VAEILIRPAARTEAAAIRALIRAVRINPTGLDWRRFLVAVAADGQVVGTGQVKLHRDGSRELASIAVRPAFRERGIAGAIIARLLDREGQRPLYLVCRAALRKFYERFGFRTAGPAELPPYFQRLKRLGDIIVRFLPEQDQMTIMRVDQ
jgi:N-acetylglutamate synthase-like GNAT family acetyltransferase